MQPSVVTVGIESIFIIHDFRFVYVKDRVLWFMSVGHMLSLGDFTRPDE